MPEARAWSQMQLPKTRESPVVRTACRLRTGSLQYRIRSLCFPSIERLKALTNTERGSSKLPGTKFAEILRLPAWHCAREVV